MSALKTILCDEIAANGPMPLDVFMQRALTDPTHGYYMQRQPFGTPDKQGGDFITAPEVSQMFGELLGAWVADLWDRMGRPTPFCLAELGPGRGTLMADMLRAASVMPAFGEAVQVHFVEISPHLRAAQKQAVPHAFWHDRPTDLPALPSLIIANEFFDALPIAQFKYGAAGWHEIMVDAHDDALVYRDATAQNAPFSDALAGCLPDNIAAGDIVETSAASEAAMTQIATHIAQHGGAALVLDYGHAEKACGDSFQALHQHRHVDPLDAPGLADITAHVNFPLLAHLADKGGLAVAPIVEQGSFLEALGLSLRAQQLMQASPGREKQINEERLRLAAPQHMGQLFKVLGVAHPTMPPLAGFAQ